MNCGETLLIPAPDTREETPHLWIVVTEPDPLCVIVCLSTLRYDKDQTVVLRCGEHAFIGHDTAVLYHYAKIVDSNHLEQQIVDGLALRHDPCSPQLLKLVQDGVLASPNIPPKVERFYREWRQK
jgi:hypothetical protein